MYRQKIKRIFAIILIVGYIFLISPVSFCANSEPVKSSNSGSSDKVKDEVKTTDNFDFSHYDDPKANSSANKVAKNAMGTGINVIRIVATGTSVIMLTYIGIKYMMAAPSEKAEFKKSASIFILGAILIFAAGNILEIITNFTTNNITTK